MRNKINIYNWLILLVIGFGLIIACGELDDTHKEFIQDGEEIYVGTPLEVFTNSGNERIKFNVVINADPKISKGIIEWDNGASSQDFTVSRTSEGIDTLGVEVNIPEGSYTFEITLFDDLGHSSLTYEHSAMIYGPNYISGLKNRMISSVTALPDRAEITWSTAEAGVVETIFTYEDNNGDTQEVVILAEETETVATNYKIGGTYSVVTKYVPNELALEMFSCTSESSTFPATVSLDRSLWQKVVLPTDGEFACYGGSIENLWDGSTGSWYHSYCVKDGTDGIPHHFTLDFGVNAVLSKFLISPRESHNGRNPKHFQVWGIDDLTGAETTADPKDPNWADDAVAKGWTLLLDHETDASWNGSNADYVVDIPENIKVKYIRFRFLESYESAEGNEQTALSEFKFWASSIN